MVDARIQLVEHPLGLARLVQQLAGTLDQIVIVEDRPLRLQRLVGIDGGEGDAQEGLAAACHEEAAQPVLQTDEARLLVDQRAQHARIGGYLLGGQRLQLAAADLEKAAAVLGQQGMAVGSYRVQPGGKGQTALTIGGRAAGERGRGGQEAGSIEFAVSAGLPLEFG